jgi:hypothetical protein
MLRIKILVLVLPLAFKQSMLVLRRNASPKLFSQASIASSNPIVKQRTSASADLDDDNGNLARVMITNLFQKALHVM